ncbi:MAG: TIGR03557 family F420-dependent LLM class oxidoreductase [Chloroflexi bacterium]|nr:TIGR03557 family F420-dependent LLM class oxidoreductase [Chloroflexota bacterium]
MATIGYSAMLEQFRPNDLLRWCRLSEEVGFTSIMASDHFNPWTPRGQAVFVWSWLGAVGVQTRMRLGTGVTPPGYRSHPAIVAQAAATLEAMFPGRFWLGLGAGEALNEHILAEYWPEAPTRVEKLYEAIDLIRKLFTGKNVRHQGKYFQMETARLYTLPATPPPIYVATSGPVNAERTGRFADGIITVGAADEKIRMLMGRFEKGAREAGKDPAKMPRIIQLHVSYAATGEQATEQAMTEWPNGGMRFPKQDIRTPEDFEAIRPLVRPEDFAGRVLISADIEEHRAHVQRYLDLGFTEVYLHNVGANQEEFLQAYGRHVLPRLRMPESGPAAER